MRNFYFLLICLFPLGLSAQGISVDNFQRLSEHPIEIGGSMGIMMYQGDLVAEALDVKTARPCFSGFMRYVVTPKFSMRGSIATGYIVGDDANYIRRRERGFSVQARLNEVHLAGEWYPWSRSMFRGDEMFQKVISPYVFGGFNLAFADPQPKQDNVILPKELNATTSFSGTLVGIGAYYHMNNDRIAIGIEGGLRYVFSDMLDGFSTRGNPNNNDTYFVGGMNISYRFN